MWAYTYETYKPLLDPERMNSTRRITLPQPEFYVFYNGKRSYPPEKTIRLSDLYEPYDKKIRHTLDLSVGVYNINIDTNPDLMQRCEPLLHYETFVELVERYEPVHGRDRAIEMAIEECLKRGIMVEFLKLHGKRGIANMLYKELDQVKLRAVWEDCGREEGRLEGIEQGMAQGITQGRAESIEEFIKLIEKGHTTEEIKQILTKKQI
jgi:hypothetical protein